ncbi:MAG: SGNH/GDSL hydrolase family protein [Muribaculaceae bacterium]|nr:SGNH/GDSL hydrolase family protein [Muribaculaceae bacterium]MDE6321844.1 SGNH/GDSL hydrolase family protein [Muribaculaceae bacterium]
MKLNSLLCIAILAAASLAHVKADPVRWVDGRELTTIGTLAPDAKQPFSRLPDSLAQIRPELWDLGSNSAGIALRFRSDATDLHAKWRSHKKFNMNHMTATGIRGLDLYLLTDDGHWTTASSARPRLNDSTTTVQIIGGMPRQMREYMLYMPLYDGVDSLWVGVDSAAILLPPAVNSPRREKPIVWYGTSLLQGGCAARPGMAHTNIIERDLDLEVINLGFSGNAKLDPEIARLMAQADAGLYIIDALPNVKAAEIPGRIDDFYAIIRSAHPDVPIMLVESPYFPITRLVPQVMSDIKEKNTRLREFYDKTVAAGDNNVYYFSGEDLLGDEWEGTVDNYHFTDLGMKTVAQSMLPAIKAILQKK